MVFPWVYPSEEIADLSSGFNVVLIGAEPRKRRDVEGEAAIFMSLRNVSTELGS